MKKKYIFSIYGCLGVTFVFLCYCFFPVITYDARYSQHVNYHPSESLAPGRIFLADRHGRVITDKAYSEGYYKAIKTDLESEFVRSLLFIEDKNFYDHFGVNIPAKLRALGDNISGKQLSGGSTITEQYVKNKYFKQTPRSYLQKLREAVLALYVESQKSKEEILNIYYHDAYFGNRLYGIGAAIEVYFDKERLEDLTQEEIVILLTLLHNPAAKSYDEKYFQKYFSRVKGRLGYEFQRSYFGKIPVKKNIDLFPFVTQKFIDQRGGNVSIDADLQEFARETLQETLKELSEKNVSNAAVFAIKPQTQETLIYQGSKDFYASDIDGEVDVIGALRQPGSTMKPFLYLLALESGASPDSLLIDIESEYNSFQEDVSYISENYSLKEYGLVRLKKALGNSFNNATVRLARNIGLERVYDFYKQEYGFDLPFRPEHYGYSMVLGNPSIRLEDLVRSYVKLGDLTDTNKFLLYDILSDPDNRDVSFGVNSILSSSIPQAVKTGTSSDFRDNLVISYHPDFILGVWVGNNDNSSMQGVTGITGAGYIWRQVIEKAIELGYIQNKKILPPKEIELGEYCLDINCYRKEQTYEKKGREMSSRPADELYSEKDIFGEISEYERNRLGELGIRLRQ